MEMDALRPALDLASPWMNAAGTLGFAPPADLPQLEQPGAFVTNAVSLRPRTPAESRALLEYPGGVLIHSGLVNPGLAKVLKLYAPRWARSNLPIWVHLLAESPAEIYEMARQLENVEGVAALEVGLPPQADMALCLEMVQAACGELPVAAHLPLNRASADWPGKLAAAGASGLVLGAPRGALPGANGKLVSGRLYGPGLLPHTLAALKNLAGLGLPLITGAGIFSRADGAACLAAGALAVQVDTALWQPGI